MSRTALISLLRYNWEAIGVPSADAIMSSGAADDIELEIRPFVMLRWQTDSPAFTARGPIVSDLDIWVHDIRGSYDRINDAIDAIKTVLHAAVHVSLPDLFPADVEVGVTYDVLVQADWQSTSADSYDVGYNTSTRYCGYRVVTRTP